MAWFKKKPDPISDRARALNEEIAALESEIKRLDTHVQQAPPQPKLRSTALPHSGAARASAEPPAPAPMAEPDFLKVDLGRLNARTDGAFTPAHYNDLGVRKYDLPALLRRIRTHFRGPATTNPKLVNYLAAGGIQGLRPLRYEKRVARNRFIFFAVFLFLILLGSLVVFFKNR